MVKEVNSFNITATIGMLPLQRGVPCPIAEVKLLKPSSFKKSSVKSQTCILPNQGSF